MSYTDEWLERVRVTSSLSLDDTEDPVSCFYCQYCMRDTHWRKDRRFYCSLVPEEKRRVTTIYSSADIPKECPNNEE